MTPPETGLASQWSALTDALGIPRTASLPVFADLCRRYAEPSRFYHTLTHVAQMLQTLAAWSPVTEGVDWDAIRLAVWFHDAVYDSRAADNEEQSAALAREVLRSWNIAEERCAVVERLILATKTHTLAEDDRDAALFLDADLMILGSGPDEYDRYRHAIRDEYAWVSEKDYRAGRGRVLHGFLARPQIYRTVPAFDAWEYQARRNIGAEIKWLLR